MRRLALTSLVVLLGVSLVSANNAALAGDAVPAPDAAPEGSDGGRPDLHTLTLLIRDPNTEQEVPARCTVIDCDDEPVYPIPAAGCFYHQPYGDSPSYFYSGGRSHIFVPEGPVEVTVSRGFEFETIIDTVGVRNDTTHVIHIDRWIDLNDVGLYSGDCHTHAAHSGGIYTVKPEHAHFMARAEGLNVINCLDAFYYFTGGPDSCSTSDCIVYMTEEHRSAVYGHSDLLGLTSLVIPPSTTWWPLVMDIADEVHAQPGAAIICAHPVTTDDFFDIETVQGKMLARELPLDVLKHKIDAYELLAGYSSSHRRTMEMWYRLLNCGFRLPACAGTDAGLSASYGKPPGSYRVYVQVDGAFTYESWLENLVAGRTFVTNGPLFTDFQVRNFSLGDSVNLESQGTAYLDGHVRVECATPLTRVDILCNGVINQTFFASPDQKIIDTSFIVPVDESSWIAARASGPKVSASTVGDSLFAHSGPVYFSLNGDRIVEAASALELTEWMGDFERLAVMQGEWTDPGQSSRLFDEIEAARQFYQLLADGAVTGIDSEISEGSSSGVTWLGSARPNPFTSEASLAFFLPEEARVRLSVHTPSGRLVQTVVDKELPAGTHAASWDGLSAGGMHASSGVYLVRLESDAGVLTRKAVLLR